MPEVVRVDASSPTLKLAWPARCPRCGSTESLMKSSSRVGRVKSVRPNLMGGLTMKSDVMYLSFPMCERHSGKNWLAGRILEKSPLMLYVRAMIYLGAIWAVPILIGLITTPGTLSRLADLGALAIFPLIGALGIAAIFWARLTTSVWPIRFDPDMDVIEVRFSDDEYASDFKHLNRSATDEQRTASPPWYMRSLPWKVLVVGIFLMVMYRIIT